MRFGLRGRRAMLLCAPLFAIVAAACGESSTIVQVNGVPADLSIVVADDAVDMGSAAAVKTLELPVGESASLAASATNAVGLPLGTVAVTWTSSDPAVVTVTSDGTVTAVAPGTAQVEASAGEVTATVTVSVPVEGTTV